MFLIKVLISIAIYFILFVLIYRRRFYRNPSGKRAVIRHNKTKVDILSHHYGSMYNVKSDTGTYGIIHISELKPIYFEI